MQKRATFFIGTFLTYIVTSISFAQSAASTPPDETVPFQRVGSLVRTNSLDLPGGEPFHITISFDLYDLDGQQKETGTVEEWWTGPKISRTVITAPSLDGQVPASEAPYNRETYLARQLAGAILHPIGNEFTHPKTPLSVTRRTEGLLQLDCVAKAQTISKPPLPLSQICTEPSSDSVVVQTGEGDLLIHRDAFQTFHGVRVPWAASISYLGRKAIVGKVVSLEDVDRKAEPGNAPAVGPNSGTTVDATVLTGSRLTSKAPVYPKAAKKAHQHGSVTLIAIITKQGTLRDLDIVATPGALFSQSAIDAVQTWTYQPYLLRGAPTEVETTITVNYSLEGKT